jgi:hypothetical protein
MDTHRFDRLAKQLAARTPSRRGFLAGVVAGGVALVTHRGVEAATCCTGHGAHAAHSTGGSSSACCGPTQQCFSRDGRIVTCGGRQSAEGGRAGCCNPGDTICQQRILTPPPCPTGCTCA